MRTKGQSSGVGPAGESAEDFDVYPIAPQPAEQTCLHARGHDHHPVDCVLAHHFRVPMQLRQQLAVAQRHAYLGHGTQRLSGGPERIAQFLYADVGRGRSTTVEDGRGKNGMREAFADTSEECFRIAQQVGLLNT